MHRDFLVSFVLVLLVRILLFNFPSFHIDMNTWEAWSYRLVNGGFSRFYSPNFYSEYFPGYLYLLWVIGVIYHFLFSKLSFSSFQFEVLLKSITTIFDLGTSYLIYKAVFSIKPKLAAISSLIYFANPAVIFNSSVWGQIDGIYTFFLFLASYLLIDKFKRYSSVFFSSIAFVIKPQAIFLLPVLLANIFKKYRLKSTIVSILLFVSSIIIFSLPFFPNNPISGFVAMSQRSADLYPYTSLFAFNFWGIFGFWRPDSQTFIISLEQWGIVLYGISLIAIISPILQKAKNEPRLIYLSLALTFFSSFLFLTRMHERYLFPVLALYLIYAIQNRKLLIIYFLISLVHLLNLWYVYYYYDFVYNFHVVPNFLYNLIDSYKNIFSILLMVSFFFILVNYYGSKNKKTA